MTTTRGRAAPAPGRPTAASRPSWPRPEPGAGRAAPRRRRARPRRRAARAGPTVGGLPDRRPGTMPPSVHSTGTTASAPARQRRPGHDPQRLPRGERVGASVSPAAMSPTTGSVTGRVGGGAGDVGGAHRVAVHRRSCRSGGRSTGAVTSSASTQPCASSSASSSGGSGRRSRPRQSATGAASTRRSRRQARLRPSATNSPSHAQELRAEVGALAGEPDDGLEVVEPVAGVVAAAAEHDAVARRRPGPVGAAASVLQRVGELDLAAAAGRGARAARRRPRVAARSGR